MTHYISHSGKRFLVFSKYLLAYGIEKPGMRQRRLLRIVIYGRKTEFGTRVDAAFLFSLQEVLTGWRLHTLPVSQRIHLYLFFKAPYKGTDRLKADLFRNICNFQICIDQQVLCLINPICKERLMNGRPGIRLVKPGKVIYIQMNMFCDII